MKSTAVQATPTVRRESWRDAPEGIRARVRGFIREGLDLRAVDCATSSGYSIAVDDLEQGLTRKYLACENDSERWHFRSKHGMLLRAEARAVERIASYVALGTWATTRAEADAAERAAREEREQREAAAIEARTAAILSAGEAERERVARARAEAEIRGPR